MGVCRHLTAVVVCGVVSVVFIATPLVKTTLWEDGIKDTVKDKVKDDHKDTYKDTQGVLDEKHHRRIRRNAVTMTTTDVLTSTVSFVTEGNVTIEENSTSSNNDTVTDMMEDYNATTMTMPSTTSITTMTPTTTTYITPHIILKGGISDTNMVLVATPISDSGGRRCREAVDQKANIIPKLRIALSTSINSWCGTSPQACCLSTTIQGPYDPAQFPLLNSAHILVVAGMVFAQNGSRIYHAAAVPPTKNSLCDQGTPKGSVSDTPVAMDADTLLSAILASRDEISAGLVTCCDVELGDVYLRVAVTSRRHVGDVALLPLWAWWIIMTLVLIVMSMCLAALIIQYKKMLLYRGGVGSLHRIIAKSPKMHRRHRHYIHTRRRYRPHHHHQRHYQVHHQMRPLQHFRHFKMQHAAHTYNPYHFRSRPGPHGLAPSSGGPLPHYTGVRSDLYEEIRSARNAASHHQQNSPNNQAIWTSWDVTRSRWALHEEGSRRYKSNPLLYPRSLIPVASFLGGGDHASYENQRNQRNNRGNGHCEEYPNVQNLQFSDGHQGDYQNIRNLYSRDLYRNVGDGSGSANTISDFFAYHANSSR